MEARDKYDFETRLPFIQRDIPSIMLIRGCGFFVVSTMLRRSLDMTTSMKLDLGLMYDGMEDNQAAAKLGEV